MGNHKTSQASNQPKDCFFPSAANWIMAAIDGRFTEPPVVPVDYKNSFFDGRGVYHALFQNLPKLDDPVDGKDNRKGKVIDSMLALNLVNESAFDETVKALSSVGWSDHLVVQDMIEDEIDSDEDSFGSDDFDGALTDLQIKLHNPESVVEPGTSEEPKKKSDRFSKLHDWVMRLPISLPRRVLLAELIRGCCGRSFTWIGNPSLAAALGVLPRQIQKQLRALETDGHITIRKYSKSWCKTQRLIFINQVAEWDGINPKMDLPPTYKELMQATGKPKPKAQKQKQRVASLKTANSYIGCPIGRCEDVQEDTRRDNASGLSLKRLNPEDSDAVRGTPCPKAGSVPVRHANLTEAELVKQAKAKTSVPAIDWAEKNLPADNAEKELARVVRCGQVSHIHPQWLKGRSCWMVRINRAGERPVYLTPKITHDGWFQVTTDSAIVPLIDSDNVRVNQAKFAQLVQIGMTAPDTSQPVKHSAN